MKEHEAIPGWYPGPLPERGQGDPATCDCLDRGSTRIDVPGNDLDGLIIHLPGCAFIAQVKGVTREQGDGD